ncbi:MAG: hypothetical protein EPO08_09590 [Rhodospirillaceae bacterium]|nr:MAG: hypothetical protein EPO08_09590 [Rhodospirillaceae bacterium]
MKDGKAKPGKAKEKSTAKKKAAATGDPIFDAETRRAQLRVAKARDKLRMALDDPEKRKQMVEAIRTMMRGEK